MLAKAGLKGVSLVSAAIATYLILSKLLLWPEQAAPPIGPLILLVSFSAIAAWTAQKGLETARLATRAMIVCLVVIVLMAAAVRPMATMIFCSSSVVMIHLLLRPNPALAVSIFTVGGAVLLSVVGDGLQTLYFHWERALANTLMTLGFCQLLGRHWRAWHRRYQDIADAFQRLLTEAQLQRQEAITQVKRLQLEDPLTGLPNAEGFALALGQLLRRQASTMPIPAVCISLQLTGLQETSGGDAQTTRDQFLRQFTDRLRAKYATAALIGRVGNEDFRIFVEPGTLDGKSLQTWLSDALQAIDQPVLSEQAFVLPRVRMGASRYPADGEDPHTLLGHATTALRLARRLNSTRPVLYESGVQSQLDRQEQLLRDMAVGIREDQFVLHYQPLVDSTGGPLHKAEALIRWLHPEKGTIRPVEFIPLAENTPIINDITHWVLQEAARQVKLWRQTLHPEMQISVNIPPSYLTLCAEQPQETVRRIQALALPSGALVAEITEGTMMDVTPELLKVLALLKELGFQIALDDFGVGYSTLGQLHRLPLDFLKIDRSFVDGLETSAPRQAICQAIVQMGHTLGHQLVAEGVETVEQRRLLTDMGVDLLQGFLYAQPMASAELTDWIRNLPPRA